MSCYNISLIDFLTFTITLSGFYFAYFQWFKSNRERKIHLLKLLKVQLDCLGPWVGSDGDGYGNDLTEKQKFENSNPSKVIYRTGSTPLINATLLEQMSDVPKDIIGEISQLYYDFKRIESIQEYRNLLTSSDIKLSLSIKKKHLQAECNSLQYSEFLKSLTIKEKTLVQLLVRYAKTLHCDVIGNKNKSARQHWDKAYEWVKKEIENYRRPQLSFIFISFVIILLLLFVTNICFGFISNGCILCLSLLITLWTAINTKAIIFTNTQE